MLDARWRGVLGPTAVLAALCATGCPASNRQARRPVIEEHREPEADRELAASPASAPASRPAARPGEGELVRHTGRLDMDRLAGGKRLQATVLQLDDGRRLLLAYRPVKTWFRYIGKRVVVQGRHYTNPPHVQSVRADHFRVHSIALAPGETPHPAAPTRLPTPDTVRTRAELEAHDGRWVQLFARLRTGSRRPDGDWCDAVVVLDDGTEVWSSMYRTTFERVWKPLLGRQVTLIGRALRDREDARRPLQLVGPLAICAGEVERCGMDQDVHTRNRGPIKIR